MLAEILAAYLKTFPEERSGLKVLKMQIKDNQILNDRRNFVGHVTGSAIVLSPDKSKVLLIYHKLFDAWQQPGGHWELDETDPRTAAWREAEEETGIWLAKGLDIVTDQPLVPLDIDSHPVPPRPVKDEPAHRHHDFRYVFIAKTEKLTPQEAEVAGAKWVALDDPDTQRITRAIKKLHRFNLV